jgi:hypothetical protein
MSYARVCRSGVTTAASQKAKSYRQKHHNSSETLIIHFGYSIYLERDADKHIQITNSVALLSVTIGILEDVRCPVNDSIMTFACKRKNKY